MLRTVLHLIFTLVVAFAAFPAASADAQTLRRGVTVGRITAADIPVLASWKVNVVRYPLSLGRVADTAGIPEYFGLLEAELQHLDALLPVFQQHGIKVIINFYSPPGGHHSHGEDGTLPRHNVFFSKDLQLWFQTFWLYIAARYANNPAIDGYDLLNEPATGFVKFPKKGPKDWPALALILIKLIRSVDPTHTIYVQTHYSLPQFVNQLKGLVKIKNIAISVHNYEPFDYTHQFMFGLPFGVTYPDVLRNQVTVMNHLAPVVAFQKKYKKYKIRVLLGEFSVVRWAPNAAQYIREMCDVFDFFGWDWTYHAYGEADPWNVSLGPIPGDLTPAATPTDRELALRGCLSRNP